MVEREEEMMGGKKKFILLLFVVGIFSFILFKHILVSDEERIKRVLFDGKAAIEKEDLLGVMAHISYHYRDEYGLNYLGAKSLFNWLFQEFDNIAIHVERINVEVTAKKKGKATLHTWATARGRDRTGYIVGGAQRPCLVLITLEKERRSWRVIKAEGVVPGEILL